METDDKNEVKSPARPLIASSLDLFVGVVRGVFGRKTGNNPGGVK